MDWHLAVILSMLVVVTVSIANWVPLVSHLVVKGEASKGADNSGDGRVSEWEALW